MATEGADERILLLSVQPRFTAAIMAGSKTVELRRSRMQAAPGSQILLYSSTPVKAVVATAVLERIDARQPQDLWARSGADSAVSRAEFDRYFAGADQAYGLHLRDVTNLPQPVTLRQLRDLLGVEPPQSFRYLTRAQVDALLPPSASAPAPGRRPAYELLLAVVSPLLALLDVLSRQEPRRGTHRSAAPGHDDDPPRRGIPFPR